MAGKNRFVFKIAGPEKNSQHLDLSIFAQKIKQFLDVLTHSSSDKAVFHVVGLSHSSPVIIECEPRGQDPLLATAVSDSFRKNLDLAVEEKAHQLSNPFLYALEQLAEYNPQEIARAEIHIVEESNEAKKVYKLDDGFRESLLKARSAEERVVSTIDGRIEQINIHNKANTFRIYTFFSSVNCKFPHRLLGDVQSALGSFVSVSGACFYRPDAAFPYKIDVSEMKILPPSDKLPSLRDLYGIAPDATGEMSSELFVRRLRDEWDKGP